MPKTLTLSEEWSQEMTFPIIPSGSTSSELNSVIEQFLSEFRNLHKEAHSKSNR